MASASHENTPIRTSTIMGGTISSTQWSKSDIIEILAIVIGLPGFLVALVKLRVQRLWDHREARRGMSTAVAETDLITFDQKLDDIETSSLGETEGQALSTSTDAAYQLDPNALRLTGWFQEHYLYLRQEVAEEADAWADERGDIHEAHMNPR